MDRVVEIERALNGAARNKDGSRRVSVPTGPVRVAIGYALRDLSAAYRVPGASRTGLDKARRSLEDWMRTLPAGGEISIVEFDRFRPRISRAYVEIAGVRGVSASSPSLGTELIESLSRLPDTLGTSIGAAAGFVGDTAGSIVGGLLAGLWPLLIVVAVVLYASGRFKR